MRVAIACVLLGLALSAPVPRIQQGLGGPIHSDNGLLVLVPTVSTNPRDKRDVEYEVIAIPGEILRREIRQIAGLYQAPNPASAAPAFGGEAVLSAAGDIFETTGNNFNSIGAATATNAGNVIGFISEAGAGAGAAAAEIAGSGLSYAGQLSGALLRSLLQVPAIKARVVTKLIHGAEPLTQAISDVIAESSGDLAYHFETKAKIIGEAVNIVTRLITDTLALKGRVIAAIGGTGFDTAAGVIQSGVKIGGALFETGGNVVNAIGGGVREVIDLGKAVNFPAKPTFPQVSIPQLPALVIPQIDLPQLEFPDFSSFKNKNKNKQFPSFNLPNKQLPAIHLPPIHLPPQHIDEYSTQSSSSTIHLPSQHRDVFSPQSSSSTIHLPPQHRDVFSTQSSSSTIHLPPQHSHVFSSSSSPFIITPAQQEHQFIAPSPLYTLH